MGLPFALTLLRPELDQWSPGEHNGTFRGNNHAFVTATAALKHFWSARDFQRDVERRSHLLETRLTRIAADHGFEVRGRGMRSEEHTSELQSLMRISYAVFCLKKKTTN